ncbi:MAG: TerC family protein [Planctomycetales bacterium]|nr:TerC family protein [Planctomycetales bacterium]
MLSLLQSAGTAPPPPPPAPAAPPTAAGLELWIYFHVLIVVLLTVDLLVLHRKAHEVRFREALWESLGWIGVSLAFGAWIWHRYGAAGGFEWLTGYAIEKALSADNLFVFVLIFAYFKVPAAYQHRVLYYGILGAVLMRGAFIGAGNALVQRFEWILYLFGALLIWTAWKLLRAGEISVEPEKNPALRLFRRLVPATTELHGQRFWVREGGKLLATPLVLVLVIVETTDIVFAVDSIPAIFGIVTAQPRAFLIYSSNIFAILGLRALYFLLAGLMQRMRYLRVGLAVILGFIGVKMIVETPKWVHVDPLVSCGTVLAILFVAGLASWWAGPAAVGRADPHPAAPGGGSSPGPLPGAVPGRPDGH